MEVDLDTGEVSVTDVVSADEIGRVIHQVLAEGQVEGGSLQAVGYATIEELKLIDGRYQNDRLATYLIPTAMDAPRITAILLEHPYSGAPHGAKGVGELPMDVVAPAIVAAIHDAIGAWITDLPATSERVLAALTDSAPPRTAGDQRGVADVTYRLTVNGVPTEVEAPGMRRLLDVLREDLGLTGTKEGCGEGECGACSVLLDGAVVDSCLVPLCQVNGAEVQTVEGLDANGALNTLQAAFLETGGAQCGICTPGMLMAGQAFLASRRRANRGGRPRGHRRQPVPLHGLHQDHRRHRPGRRAGRRGRRDRGLGQTDAGRAARREPGNPDRCLPAAERGWSGLATSGRWNRPPGPDQR